MKRLLLYLLAGIFAISGFSQVPVNHNWLFTFNGNDTLLSREQIHFLGQTNQFPADLKWKNSAFSIRPSIIDGVGLFSDSIHSFGVGEDVGWAFIKVASTDSFMDDYYESNIGMFVNNSQTPNVAIISSPQGLMMRALTAIGPNTEIIARYQDIIDIFPSDNTVKFLIKYW
jgi:hypothetical protein